MYCNFPVDAPCGGTVSSLPTIIAMYLLVMVFLRLCSKFSWFCTCVSLHMLEISFCIISPSTIEQLLTKKPLHHGTTLHKCPVLYKLPKMLLCMVFSMLGSVTPNLTLLLSQQWDHDAPLFTPSLASSKFDHSTATIENEFHLHKLSVPPLAPMPRPLQ